MISIPIADAVRKTFQKGYSSKDLYADIGAGIVVSLIALPLAMALAISVGLPPEHGIYTVIVAGFLTALFGGSKTQVSGPTAAFIVILAPIVTTHGLEGLVIAQFIAGIIIVILGITKCGKFISHMPYTVISGFTAGIAVVIATVSLKDFLGLNVKLPTGRYLEKLSVLIHNIPNFKWSESLIGLICLLILIQVKKITEKVPPTIIAVTIVSIISYIFNSNGLHIATIGNVFSYTGSDGILRNGIPAELPDFKLLALPDLMELNQLMVPALTIAILAALESLLSATIADNMSGTKHEPNSELVGIGIANIITPFAAGIPATGAIARTAANIKNGARSPFAAIFHAFFVLLYVLILSPLIAYVPMASLAAILIYTAYQMSHFKDFIKLVKQSNHLDKIAALSSFILTIITDMVIGVTIGVGVHIIGFLFNKYKKVNV
jgi:SulP family sulfate permease